MPLERARERQPVTKERERTVHKRARKRQQVTKERERETTGYEPFDLELLEGPETTMPSKIEADTQQVPGKIETATQQLPNKIEAALARCSQRMRIKLHHSSSCADRYTYQLENNIFTTMCSESEAGSDIRLIDFVYHSNSRLESNKKKRITDALACVLLRSEFM